MPKYKLIIGILSLFILNSTLLSFSTGNKKALTEIKKVLIEDKNYRIIALLPYKNNTKNDYYEYIGRTIQKFLYNNLLTLNIINITTNDIFVPEKYKTNKSAVIAYETNFTREPVILSPERVNDIYYKSAYPENKKMLAEKLNADYIIWGEYNFYKRKKNKYTVLTYVYNYVQNSNFFVCKSLISRKNIEKDIENISEKLFKFFNPVSTGNLEIITIYSNFQLFIDDKIVEPKLKFNNIPAGEHKITLRFENNYVIEKDLNIIPAETTTVYFTNRSLFKQNAILKVITEPTNAKVFLDVKFYGNTPVIITNLRIKEYRLRIEKPGYRIYFKNIKLNNGTNIISTTLEKEITPEMRKEIHKRNKIIMYSTLGLGSLSLLTAYYFYAKSDIVGDRYDLYRKEEDKEKFREYKILSFTFGAIGLASLGVSFIYFLKVIKYDDVNIGMIDNIPQFALSRSQYRIFIHRRF